MSLDLLRPGSIALVHHPLRAKWRWRLVRPPLHHRPHLLHRQRVDGPDDGSRAVSGNGEERRHEAVTGGEVEKVESVWLMVDGLW